ncbi:hypothetical protein DAEQUDRAFT_334957 [Daedalea quercina L-15889]|uniref:Uncharacterized protein n=1 Tax=Daedalea quercina L-15889 TaxID=1314783 RepID=A0A165PNG0_9APHY|nr:hypothetical protein DAEQUDRAFT_334957 [Daedalea quercina L-15889]
MYPIFPRSEEARPDKTYATCTLSGPSESNLLRLISQLTNVLPSLASFAGLMSTGRTRLLARPLRVTPVPLMATATGSDHSILNLRASPSNVRRFTPRHRLLSRSYPAPAARPAQRGGASLPLSQIRRLSPTHFTLLPCLISDAPASALPRSIWRPARGPSAAAVENGPYWFAPAIFGRRSPALVRSVRLSSSTIPRSHIRILRSMSRQRLTYERGHDVPADPPHDHPDEAVSRARRSYVGRITAVKLVGGHSANQEA